MKNLRNIVEVSRRFLRSVNIVRDQKKNTGLDGYVITPLVQRTLSQISESFNNHMADRAFTLTGPYGTGKSSFGLLLYHLLQWPGDNAWGKLRDVNPDLYRTLHKRIFGSKNDDLGFIVLPVTSRRSSVASLLAEAFDDIQESVREKASVKIDALRSCKDSKTAVRLVEEITATIVNDGFKGIFFIFDEFGKVFEEACFNKKDTDIFLLQDLAEAASRSRDMPIFFMGMLHQGFGSYVDDIHDIKTRNEFAKIEGRFQPLSFIETPAAQLRLLAEAISRNAEIPKTDNWEKIIREASAIQLHTISGLSLQDFQEYANRVWPIHPVAMLALPLLFRRFGQNERSVFTFLASNEPRGFQDILENLGEGEFLNLSHLFDYLITNYETQLSRHPQGKVFLEANDILNSKNLSPDENELVKVVSVLSALGKQSNLKASPSMVRLALGNKFSSDTLKKLQSNSILVYRTFSDSYCVWEGSDVDLIDCGEKADRALGQSSFSIAIPLMESLPAAPIIAKRHSFVTGALRYFSVEYVDTPDDLATIVADKKNIGNACGRVLICFAASSATIDTFEKMGQQYTADDSSLLFAIPENIGELKASLYEIQKLKWIVDNTEELRDDRIALREVELRLAEATQRVAQLRITLTDPRPAPVGCGCRWIWRGEQHDLKSCKEVSGLLSRVCDKLYSHTPRVLNEMINKRKISGQAAAARNNLIKYINTPDKVEQQYFGISGFPPARSIYEGLLLDSGLHRKINGHWQIAAPEEGNAVNLFPVWQLLEKEVFAATESPMLLKDLYAKMAEPPYGVLEGIMPILVASFFVLNRKEVTLYQEGSFIPDPQEAHFELMIRRPDLFAIAGARITGMRLQIVERLAHGLNTEHSVSHIVRHLYRMLGTLSKYAMNTDRVSSEVKAFRQAFADAKSPEKLLFIDLPRVFGLKPIGEDNSNPEDFDEYFNKLNLSIGALAALLPDLIKEQRGILLAACGLPNSKDGWDTLYERACFLAPKITNTELIPFIQNITNTVGDWNKADSVIGYMVSTPLENWSALDINKFPGVAEGKAQLFIDAYKPYSKSVAALTKAEQKAADLLKTALLKQLAGVANNVAVTRAALLGCIEALDKES